MKLIPIIALIPQDDIEALRPVLLELAHIHVSDRQRRENGWVDEQVRWGVLIHALAGALLAGDLELLRLPDDASGAA